MLYTSIIYTVTKGWFHTIFVGELRRTVEKTGNQQKVPVYKNSIWGKY